MTLKTPCGTHAESDEPAPDLTQRVSALIHHSSTPGAAVAVIIDGELAHQVGVGNEDLDGAQPLDANARFPIYSVTKALIATAVMQSVEREMLTLDEPVRTYLPLPTFDNAVTIRQLLNHTGGIPDYGGMPEYHDAVRTDPTRPWTSAEFLERTLANGLMFHAGSSWGYSNIGYLLLRLTLEAIHEAPLHDVLRMGIFTPLDLQHTFVARTLADTRGLTPGYSAFFRPDGSLENVAHRYHPGWVSHGLVVSTALELATMVDALFAGRLVNPESLSAMLEPVVLPFQHPLFKQPAYGLGLMIDAATTGGIVAGHGGGGPGYSTGALHFTDDAGQSITSVALANRDDPDLGLRLAFETGRRSGRPSA